MIEEEKNDLERKLRLKIAYQILLFFKVDIEKF